MRKEQIITTNNNQMEEKGMKSRFIHFKKRFVPALSGALMGVMLMSTTCFAAGTGTSAVTQPLENLKTLIIAVIGAVGVIILAKNVMEFAQAYQQQDSSTMNSALKGIVAGVMMDWPDVNVREPEQVKERMGMYFALCAQDDMKPSVAGMALAFGVDRKTIWAWANGVDSKTLPAESRNLIKKAYQLLNAQMESYMQNGKINPVAGIFLMKNNMGYADKQEVVLTPNQQLGDQIPAEDLEKKYLEDVVGASGDYDSED